MKQIRKLRFAQKFFITCIVFFVLMSASIVAYASPANPFPIDTEQADGSTITIYNKGDEFFNWTEDKNGYIIAYDEDSENWCYAFIDEESSIVPSSSVVRNDMVTFGYKITSDALAPLIENVDRTSGYNIDVPSSGGFMSSSSGESGVAPVEHTKNRQPLLVLLIEYNDIQFSTTYTTDTTAYWSNHFFGSAGNTVNTYYKEVSEKFDLQFIKPTFTQTDGFTTVVDLPEGVSSVQIKDGVARVKLNKNHPNTTEFGSQVRMDINTAYKVVEQYINFDGITRTNNYILNEDFNITSVIAGFDGSANKGKTPRIWAHASWISLKDINGKQKNISILYDSAINADKVGTYSTQGELYDENTPMPIGVSVHELGHVLGLPDLYSYTKGKGLGPYSLMAEGSWGTTSTANAKPGDTPVHLDAWSKARLGFVTPITVKSNEQSKTNVYSSDSGLYNVLKVESFSADSNQFFVVENRQLFRYDRGLMGLGVPATGGGILIYHIDNKVYDAYSGSGGRPNDNDYHKYIDLEKFMDSPKDPFFVFGDTFNKASTPNSNFYASGGHTSGTNPTTQINCHPQSRPSGIELKINNISGGDSSGGSNNGATMVVEVVKIDTIEEPEEPDDVNNNSNTGNMLVDPALESIIRDLIKKPTGDITPTDVSAINPLNLTSKGIRSIVGLEYFTALESIILVDNPIGDISALLGLGNLKSVDIRTTNVKSDGDTVTKLKAKGVNVITDPAKTYTKPVVTVDYQTGMATIKPASTSSTAFEYCVSSSEANAKSKGKWEFVLYNKLDLTSLSNKKVYIREVGATSEIYELVVSNIKKPSGKPSGVSFDASAIKVKGVTDLMEYRIGAAPWESVAVDAVSIDVSMLRNGGTMDVRTKASGSTAASAIAKVKIPAVPAAPKVNFNYVKGAFTGIGAKTQISNSAGEDKIWGTLDDLWVDVPSTLKIYGGDVLYFRNKPANSNGIPSRVAKLEVGNAGIKPSGVSIDYSTMTIKGATTTMQYQVKKGDANPGAWSNVKIKDGVFDISKIANTTQDVTIYVREKGVAASGQTLGTVPSIAVSFTVKKIPATPTAPAYADGKINGVGANYEYSTDGKTWTGFTGNSVDVSSLTDYKAKGFKLKVRLKGDSMLMTPPSQIRTITIPKQS